MSSITPDPTITSPPQISGPAHVMLADLEQADEHVWLESVLESQNTIAKFERAYGMTSSEMRRKLSTGEIEETYEVCLWSQEITFLDRLLMHRT